LIAQFWYVDTKTAPAAWLLAAIMGRTLFVAACILLTSPEPSQKREQRDYRLVWILIAIIGLGGGIGWDLSQASVLRVSDGPFGLASLLFIPLLLWKIYRAREKARRLISWDIAQELTTAFILVRISLLGLLLFFGALFLLVGFDQSIPGGGGVLFLSALGIFISFAVLFASAVVYFSALTRLHWAIHIEQEESRLRTKESAEDA